MSNVQPLLSLGDRRVGSLGSDMPCTEYCVTLGRVLPETSSDLYVMGSETGGHVSLRAEARARSNGNWKIGDGEGTIVAGLTEHGWAAVEEVYRNGNRRAYYLQSIMIHGLLQGGMWSLGAVGWLRGSEGELEDGGSRECTVLAILEPLTASTNSTDSTHCLAHAAGVLPFEGPDRRTLRHLQNGSAFSSSSQAAPRAPSFGPPTRSYHTSTGRHQRPKPNTVG